MNFDTAARHYAKQKAAKVKRPTMKERLREYEVWVEELRRDSAKDDQKEF